MFKGLLDAEEQYTQDISEFLCDSEVLDLRRRELLHRKWTKQVYSPIRRQINAELGQADLQLLLHHKRQLFNEYLEHCNRTGQVFLSSVGETRSSKSAVKPLFLTATTKHLNDPLLTQGCVHTAEDGITVCCETGMRPSTADMKQLRLPPVRLSPISRDDISWQQWQTMYINHIESEARRANRKKMNPNKTKSHLSWENYYIPCHQQVLEEELRLRKGEPFRPAQPQRAVPSHLTIDHLEPVSAM
jgi:hypothetical protein